MPSTAAADPQSLSVGLFSDRFIRHNGSSEKSGGTNNDRRRGSSAGNTSISREDLLADKHRPNSTPKHKLSIHDRSNPFNNNRSHKKAIIIERQSEEEDSSIQGSIQSSNNPLDY